MWLGSPKNMKYEMLKKFNSNSVYNIEKSNHFRALASVSVFTCSAVALLIWSTLILDSTNNPFKGIELGYRKFFHRTNKH